MKEKRILYFALGVLAVVSMGQAMGVRNDGLAFPDGSVQTTAAGLGPDAWPMICQDNDVPAFTAENLTCRSPQSGVPGGNFTVDDPVPAGYYFLVTDVHLEANTDTQTGFLQVRVEVLQGVSATLRDATFILPADLPTQTFSFGSPILILKPGQHLGVINDKASDHSAEIRVTGYLTDQPEKLRL